VLSAPEGEVSIRRFEPHGPILEEVEVQRATGGEPISLPPGSYVAEQGVVRRPFVLRPAERAEVVIEPPIRALAPGFVFVPAGCYPIGGDRLAPGYEPARVVELEAFAIARHVVTMGQYAEFLSALPGDQARARAPQMNATLYLRPDGEGRFVLPQVDQDGDEIRADHPLVLVSALDVEAFAEWRSRSDGRRYRLPTSEEWEAAARGADDRAYPWGPDWDPVLCWNVTSHGRQRGLHAVGTRPMDRSPFGLLDVAGLVREMTSSRDPDGTRIVRGGAWPANDFQCRIGRLDRLDERRTYLTFGARLVHDA
jgi:formylglycine-generating enzyme required for sulfatase activity